MGARGPKPKPTHLRVLEGNPSKRPLNTAEPQSNAPCLCPDWLDDDAKAEWNRVLEVTPPRLLTGMDVPTVSAYCQAWSLRKKALAELADMPLVVQGGAGGPIANPLTRIVQAQTDLMLRAAARLGFDPSGRSGLKLPAEKPPGRFAGLIGQTGSSRSSNA